MIIYFIVKVIIFSKKLLAVIKLLHNFDLAEISRE